MNLFVENLRGYGPICHSRSRFIPKSDRLLASVSHSMFPDGNYLIREGGDVWRRVLVSVLGLGLFAAGMMVFALSGDAAMSGPDYAWWHGIYDVSKNFYTEFLPEVKEIAGPAFYDELVR